MEQSRSNSSTTLATESVQEERTPWPILITVMVLLILPVIVLSQIGAHNRIDVVDDQMFGYFGWRIANGAVAYKDVWDNKPPGIYWTNALGFLIGGGSYGGVIALCVLAVSVQLVAFFVITSSLFFRGAAALATILASFYFTHAFFQGATNRTETFLMAFELVAVAFYVRGYARAAWWKWLAAGVCCGCAVLYKQVGLAAWGSMGLHIIILVLLGDLPWREGLKRCLLLAGGMLAIVAVAIGVIVAQGAAEQAYFAIFSFNRAYFRTADSRFFDTFLNRYFLTQYIGTSLLLPVLMAIASLIHSFLWFLRPWFNPLDIKQRISALGPACPRYMLLFAIWYAVSFYGAAVSPHRFRHYLLPTLPPLMLMAGYLISVLRTEISLTRRLQQRIWVTACFVAMGYFSLGSLTWQWEELSKIWLYRLDEGKQAVWEAVGDAAAQLTEPEDRIQCLGYLPGVYLRARRVNASRYTTTEKLGQVWDTPEGDIIRHELRDQLEADPPALMIITAGDWDAIRTTEPVAGHPDWLGPWLREFMAAHYEEATEVVEFNVFIFRRTDGITQPQ